MRDMKTYQSHTASQNHDNDSSLKVLVFNKPKGLEPKFCPKYPKWRIVVPSKEWKFFVPGVRTTISWIFPL